MTWLVNLTARAESDLANLYAGIHAAESNAAQRWYRGLKKAILSLEEFPERNPVVRKRGNIRQFLYGHRRHVYLVLYRIRQKRREVDVLHIRHGARRQLSDAELE